MHFEHHIRECVGYFQAHPYSSPFVGLFLCGLGLPLPEELFLVTAGYVCFLNGVEHVPWEMMLVTLVAVAGGDSTIFGLGHYFGPRVFDLAWMRRIVSPESRRSAERFLAEHGSRTFLAARFMPGIRMAIYLVSGALGVRFATFIFFDGLAMLVSVPIQVYLAWAYGERLTDAIHVIKRLDRLFLTFALVLLAIAWLRWHSGAGLKDGPATPPTQDPTGPASP